MQFGLGKVERVTANTTFCIIKWTDNNVDWMEEDDIGLHNGLIAMGTHNVAQTGSRLIAV